MRVGDTIRFTPDAPTTGSAYEATLTHCGGVATLASALVTSVAPRGRPCIVVGRTYAVALGEARFVKPEGVGSLLGGLLTQDIWIGVTAADEAEISMMGALSVEGSLDQDRCEPSIEFPVAADFTEAPFFSINADELASACPTSTSASRTSHSPEPSRPTVYMGGAVLAGLLDARDSSSTIGGGILEEGSDATAVCDLISAFSVNCEACSDGEEYCLSIHVDQIMADETGSELVAQDECDPEACAEGCDE